MRVGIFLFLSFFGEDGDEDRIGEDFLLLFVCIYILDDGEKGGKKNE